MPRVLKLWAFPVPQDFGHATALAAELQTQERPANRLFERFAAWADAQPVERGAWAHGIVGGRGDRPLCRFAIRDEHADAQLPGAVEAATSLGLVVFDEAGGACHLPGGATLGRDGSRRVGSHLGREVIGPLTPALAERTVLDAIEPLLASSDFERSAAAGGFGRRPPGSTQWLRWRPLDAEPGRVAFDLRIEIVLDGVRKLMDALLPLAFPGEKHTLTASGSLATCAAFHRVKTPALVARATQWFEVGSVDELRTLAVVLRGLVADVLRPLLDDWCAPAKVAWSVSEVGFDAWRIVGHATTVDERGITSATFGGRLLHTRDSGTPLVELVLAVLNDAPPHVLDRILADVRERIEALPEPRRGGEQVLLAQALELFQEAGVPGGEDGAAPQSGP